MGASTQSSLLRGKHFVERQKEEKKANKRDRRTDNCPRPQRDDCARAWFKRFSEKLTSQKGSMVEGRRRRTGYAKKNEKKKKRESSWVVTRPHQKQRAERIEHAWSSGALSLKKRASKKTNRGGQEESPRE